MSRKQYTKAEIKAQIKEKKRMKALALQRNITVFALLILLVLGLVSTTFSAFIPDNTGERGSLIADIQTSAVNQNNKNQVANLGANADIAATSYDLKCVFIYDNTHTQWSSVQLLVGHNTWSQGYMMTKIANTNLWYYNMSSTWGGATHIAIFNASSTWGGEGNSVSHRVNYMDKNSSAKALSGNMTDGIQLLTSPSDATSSTDNFTLTTSYKSSYSDLNISNTAYVQLSENGGSYANSNLPGTVKLSGYKFTSNTGTGSTSVNSTVKVSNSAADVFARTSTITLTATVESGYTFDGWYDSSGTKLSSNLSCTVTCGSSSAKYYAKYSKVTYSYTVSTNTSSGGTVSPTSGTVTAGESVSIKATNKTGYTFVEWTGLTNATIGSTTSASTTLKPTANGAKVTANFRPDTPSALTLTGNNVASGTSGDGTASNPFIVFENSGFTLTADATVVTGATAHYATASGGTYSATKTFIPNITTKGVDQSYTVYAKAFAGGVYSSGYINSTAHYMVFSHLDGANTGFTVSSNNITDADTLTLSGAYINGVADPEKSYITQTYQVSTNNSTFSDIGGSTWTPNDIGTYYFRLKTTNTKTGETVYSISQSVEVIQSTVYYNVTVVNDGTVAGTITLKADGVAFTNGEILSNSKLTISLTRPNSNYYIDYLDVDTLTEFDNMEVNGDITDYVAYDHVKSDVVIHYKLVEKPKVTVKMPTNASDIQLAYFVDGTAKFATVAGTYHVDYNTRVRYTVTPKTGYYVKSMTGVTLETNSASSAVGGKNAVVTDIAEVNATLTANNTVTVSVDQSSAVTTGGSMTIDGAAHTIGQPKALNYGVESTIVITPPEGCYALVSGNNVTATIDTEGKATFKVTLNGANKTYTVKFVANPKIYMVQPQYGSVYVTDDLGNYYFNGDPVGYGTELTVHAKPDNGSSKLTNVLVNAASIGTTDGSTFTIYEDSTATATITVDSKHTFENGTEYGKRRIFFTDNSGWGDGQVMVHYSNSNNDTNFADGNTLAMTYKYTNDMSQRVYYADIPYSFKYVNFYKKSATSSYTASALIDNNANAFYHAGGNTSPSAIHTWQENYSDYVATDRATSRQQGVTVKGEPATFEYSCDFGDAALSAEVVSGNAITYDFDKGKLYITPTENTYSYSLVKVESSASTTEKYYLIRVENFEIIDFTGLQKIYSTSVFNKIQLDLIVKGGVLNYAANYLVSDTNASGSFVAVTGTNSGFTYFDSLEAYINSFLIEYQINTMSGVKYYKVEASDSANHKATATQKTLFGTNSYKGERVIYFYNSTGFDVSKYNIRACFMDSSENNRTFVTMQKVGNTGYYRAVVPQNAQDKVNFYLCNKNTFSNDYQNFDSVDDTTEFYTYGLFGLDIQNFDEFENIVYRVTAIGDNGITGSFADFDY